MASVAITELMDVLKKSGLPIGNTPLGDTAMAQQQQIADTVTSQDSTVNNARQKYMDSINRIAQADNKLRSAYSNPSSSLYMENPLDAERLIQGARGVQGQEAQMEAGNLDQAQRDLDSKIDQAITLFGQLKSKKTGSGSSGDGKDYLDDQLRKSGIELTEALGIVQPEAQDEFLQSPTDFQRWFKDNWYRQRLPEANRMGETGMVVTTYEDLKQAMKEWSQKFGSNSEQERYGLGSGEDENIDALLEKLNL